MKDRDYRIKENAANLEEPVMEARDLAEKMGLEPFHVNYWLVDYDEMNVLAAYDGFQNRYPHWRWGMKYDRQHKQDKHGLGKIYELVVNDNPAHAYLQESNNETEQRLVITHVEAHSDFFANNKWFGMYAEENPDSAAMLEDNGRAIEQYMKDADIDRDEVERWVDHILSLETNINQYEPFRNRFERELEEKDTDEIEEIQEKLESLDLPEYVEDSVFDREWLEDQLEEEKPEDYHIPEEPQKDILSFLLDHGKEYNEEMDTAVEFDEWQIDVMERLREESFYFAPQRMTKVMNEGWAAYWHDMMMSHERFAGDDGIIDYSKANAGVLGGEGMNPYSLGRALWKYIENRHNRKNVVNRLLSVEGIDEDNFYDEVDFDAVMDEIEPEYPIREINEETLEDLEKLDDSKLDLENLEKAKDGEIDIETYPWKVLSFEGMAERHFSLSKPGNETFLEDLPIEEFEDITRYDHGSDRYGSLEEAFEDFDYTSGWRRMREIMENNIDATFIDDFLTQEFVDRNNYFAYENLPTNDGREVPVVTSVDAEDVKKKLVFQFTNFGKPNIRVHDSNFDNEGGLLLAHHYNGVELNMGMTMETLKRAQKMWGRDVHLKTIRKEWDEEAVTQALQEIQLAQQRGREPDIELPEPEEWGMMITYDGEDFDYEDLDWEEVEDIAADEVDYSTIPDEWLSPV